MGDILKEAIADAKAVRETALENAKMALEEAFTPQIKSMLSAKLKEEEDDDKEEGMHDEGEHDDEAEEGEHEEGMREDDEEAEVAEVYKLQSELYEHRNVFKYLRSKLNEVNLLNAKLLFTNKLFRSFGLTNDQKMKVVETFDRASNIREVKLVYSTMAETFGAKKTEIKDSKGSASIAVASTKSEKQEEVISEGNALRNRFKKLANII